MDQCDMTTMFVNIQLQKDIQTLKEKVRHLEQENEMLNMKLRDISAIIAGEIPPSYVKRMEKLEMYEDAEYARNDW